VGLYDGKEQQKFSYNAFHTTKLKSFTSQHTVKAGVVEDFTKSGPAPKVDLYFGQFFPFSVPLTSNHLQIHCNC